MALRQTLAVWSNLFPFHFLSLWAFRWIFFFPPPRLWLSCPFLFIFLLVFLPFVFNSISLALLTMSVREGRSCFDGREQRQKKNRPVWRAGRRSPAEPPMCSELWLPLETCHRVHRRLTPPLFFFHLAQEMSFNSIQSTSHFIFHKEIFGAFLLI